MKCQLQDTAKDKSKMGLGRVEGPNEETGGGQLSTMVVSMLRADAENQQKDDDEFYILDKESIEAIKEELSDDFLSLADEQRTAVRRLVVHLDDDRLDNQLWFEKYEWERRRQEAAKRTAAINISDEEQSSEQTPDKADAGTSQPDITQEEQPKEEHPQQTETM